MKNIIIKNPSNVILGAGTLNSLQDYLLSLLCKRLLVIVDAAVESFISEKIKHLEIEFKIISAKPGEPTFSSFDELVSEAEQFSPDCVAGIGGGSTLDVAKLVAALAYSGVPAKNFVGNGLLGKRQIPLVCIPTTSGAGSEASPNAILIDDSNGSKKGIISPYLVPDFVIIDPELMVGMPPAVTAYTGLDALTHCIEAYANRFAHPVIDVYALEGIRLISSNLKKAFDNGKDLDARYNMALGSFYGGMCLGPVNTAAVHALAYPLGTMFKIPHGLSNALLLPYVIEFNLSYSVERYAAIAMAMGAEKGKTDKETAFNGITIIKNLISDCSVPSRLSELDVPLSAIEEMARGAMEVQRLLKNNVREVSLTDAVNIYKTCY